MALIIGRQIADEPLKLYIPKHSPFYPSATAQTVLNTRTDSF